MKRSDNLELAEEHMLEIGERVVQAIIESRRPEGPVARVLTRAEARTLFDEPIPEQGIGADAAIERAIHDVLGNVTRVSDPRFFAFVPGSGNYMGAMADALASGFNVFAGTWLGGSAAAQVELTTLDWLRKACGLPAGGGGLFTSGGSMANLTALGAARHHKLGAHHLFGAVYYSDQTHSAVERALTVLGFPPDMKRRIPSDGSGRLDIAALRARLLSDRENGLPRLAVVASAGTTNTGAVDPLPVLAALCREEGLWFHIDGAYGAAAILGERGRAQLKGLQLADSIALDPHKWLFQPFECGCLLVRDAGVLPEAFAIHPEYMDDTLLGDREVNFCERGVQLSRSFRALKLWVTFQTFGRKAIADAIDHAFDLADYAAARIRSMAGWRVVTEPSMAILSFKFENDDAVNRELAASLRAEGDAMVSTTIFSGETVLRMCPINPRTRRADIDQTFDTLDRLARRAAEP